MKPVKSILIALILLIGFFAVNTAEANAGPKLRYYTTSVKMKHGYIWVEGHYKINKYGKRVWIPGHWKKV